MTVVWSRVDDGRKMNRFALCSRQGREGLAGTGLLLAGVLCNGVSLPDT